MTSSTASSRNCSAAICFAPNTRAQRCAAISGCRFRETVIGSRASSKRPPEQKITSHHWRTPAVDIDRRTGDVAALLRHQEAGEIGKFLGLARAADRNLLLVRPVVLIERDIVAFRPLHMLVGADDADQ